MVDIYPVRYVANYPGQPLEVTISGGSLSQYTSGYLTITTVPPGATIYVATLTANASFNLLWGVLGTAPKQTISLILQYGGSTISLILDSNVLAGYLYEQTFVFPGNSTIGFAFSNTSTITVAYGVIY